jgi:cation diffusion facilitator family transporter
VASTTDRYRSIRNVLWVVLFLNLAVALAKLVYGLMSHSAAMEADGFHSMFDGASNVIGLVGMWFASRPADDEHPYGHAKFETFAAALIGVLLVFAGYTVGKGAIDSLFARGLPTEVTTASFAIMLGTLAVNIFVTTWERRAGRRLGSEVLVADASHTLSDVAVSLGVIASLVIVRLGFEQADGIVALLVAIIIMRTAWGIMRGVLHTLGDAARLPADEVAAVARAVPGVDGCHAVRTRGSEAHVYVDLHVQVASGTTVEEGHAIAHQVEGALRLQYGQITDVVVHLEPAGAVGAPRRGEIDYREQRSSREAP